MSLVTVQRAKDSSKKATNDHQESISDTKNSATINSNKEQLSKIVEQQTSNFKDLKAIYSSSASKLGSSSSSSSNAVEHTTSIASKSETKTSSFLFHRKTIPRNKPSTTNTESASSTNTATTAKSSSSLMGYKSFFKRSSLNSIELSNAGENSSSLSGTASTAPSSSSLLLGKTSSDCHKVWVIIFNINFRIKPFIIML